MYPDSFYLKLWSVKLLQVHSVTAKYTRKDPKNAENYEESVAENSGWNNIRTRKERSEIQLHMTEAVLMML